MKLKISLNNYCRLCAVGNGQLLDCEEILFEEESSKTTIKDLVQMYMPDILKNNEERLLPRKICIACVRAMLNWGDFVQRSLNSHNYFMKLLSRDFEIPQDNNELVTFIRETKKEFSVSLVRYFLRLTARSRVHFVQKDGTTTNKKEDSEITETNTEFKKNAVHTLPITKQDSVDSSTLRVPVKRKRYKGIRKWTKKKRSAKAFLLNESCECVMCSPNPPKKQKFDEASIQQRYVCKKQPKPNHSIGKPQTFLDSVHSLNSSPPEKLICSPTVMLYQEVVGADEPVESDDECRKLDVENLVDGSTEWVYRLKENELAYVLESYKLDTEGTYTTLQQRLINHLRQIDADDQIPISDAQKTNNQCNDDGHDCENDPESPLGAEEVRPNPDCDAVVHDHSYSKVAPPGYFRLEDQLFKPRASGPINMQFFVGMASYWTEELISKMNFSEVMCILEICNIERESVPVTQIRKKLIRYLKYIKTQPTDRPGVSKTTDDAEQTLTADSSFALSSMDQSDHRYSKDIGPLQNPSDQYDDSPFKGFQSHDTSGNPSDQSDDSPFRGFQSTLIRNLAPEPSVSNQTLDHGSDIDDVVTNIKREVIDTSDFDYFEYQNTEFNIKEEYSDENCDLPYSPGHYRMNGISYDTDSPYLPPLNHDIHYELTKYFRTHNITEDVNKYKCYVALEKLHPAIISFYCSPDCTYSSSSSSSPSSSSSSTITCPSPYLTPSSSPTWDSPCHQVSPPKIESVSKITVKKFEDLC